MAIINKPSDYFNTVLYTGNGSNDHTITGVGFNADFVWNKNRGSDDHRLFDKARGINKFVESNTSDAEVTDAILTTNSDGYVLSNAGEVNANNGNYASWNWKANGQGSSNTAGTINTTYTSVDVDSGCSIIKYTGNGTADATIGHGLGVAPAMIFFKNLASNNWIVYHRSLGTGHYLTLNTTGASDSASGAWCTPSATLIQFNQVFGATNTSNASYIAYCFAEKDLYSKFGSYVGNDSTDGSFVYLPFKPAFVMIKRTNSANDWIMLDDKRNNYSLPTTQDNFNVVNSRLLANETNAEAYTNLLDFVSNGLKMRATYGGVNGANDSFVYMAFAQNPFVTSTGNGSIPCTAR